jgi:hypothetical protein
MLGASATRRSYVVGYAAGSQRQQRLQPPPWPLQPAHQQASCPPKADCSIANALLSPAPNPWQLTGESWCLWLSKVEKGVGIFPTSG